MRTINRKYNILIALIMLLVSCGGSDDSGDDANSGGEILNPTKSELIYPDNDEACTGGVVISNTMAKLDFDWMKSDNANSYTLFLKNLNDNSTQEFNANTDKIEITIERGIPYSWYIVSKSDKTISTSTSDTWRFYLSGVGLENYAPFPADLKAPENTSQVSTVTVNLEWEGSDVDGDIKEYDVYMDTNTNPDTKVSTLTVQNLENQVIAANTTYYWKVVTHDENGNSSTSQVFSFTTSN